jgi:hypothetical protein
MEGLMQRRRRSVLPPKRPAEVPAPQAPGPGEPAAEKPSAGTEAEQEAPKTRIKRQTPEDKVHAEERSIGDLTALVNLNIRVRRGIDDRIAACAFGLREFGLRNVSKAELVELAVLEGPLPGKASPELAAKVSSFRARYPRP